MKYSVYLGGDLWTHKDLLGNAMLARFIQSESKGRYRCVLPQDLEEPVRRTVDIRNVDLKHVMLADLAVFNFDGANLDSGTVVEFMYAKMLDIPCVLLRTDFRSAGEGNADQDPWNLMASGWPRSKVVLWHSMEHYHRACKDGSWNSFYAEMAKAVIAGLDDARGEKPLGKVGEARQIFDWALRAPGAGFEQQFRSPEIDRVIRRKARKGLVESPMRTDR